MNFLGQIYLFVVLMPIWIFANSCGSVAEAPHEEWVTIRHDGLSLSIPVELKKKEITAIDSKVSYFSSRRISIIVESRIYHAPFVREELKNISGFREGKRVFGSETGVYYEYTYEAGFEPEEEKGRPHVRAVNLECETKSNLRDLNFEIYYMSNDDSPVVEKILSKASFTCADSYWSGS